MAHSAFISGQWVSGGGAAMSSTDPATGDTVWTGKSATPDIVKEAFGSSRAAFGEWALTPYEERRAVVEAYGDIVKA
ncbi:MAG TPA: N-succinylglutamate 5-semialdehyde dehydrogenase, partial [Oceanicaulis sp.]|nr:N-succinylglutamate 5-semialdehyde dehydrogenase [Oceanicaulis sp.]